MSFWSDSEWEDDDNELPCRPKRQRASSQLPNDIEQPNPDQASSDRAKLKFCPDILKDIVIKILLIDSLCGCFKSYGRFPAGAKTNVSWKCLVEAQRAVL